MQKYGDYTGNACAAGRAFLTWASATNPQDGTQLNRSEVFFATADAVTHKTVIDLCTEKTCGSLAPGYLGDLVLECARDNCRIIVSVPEICQSMIKCPGCGPDGNCPREFTFEIEGLDRGWDVRIVDDKRVAVHSALRRDGAKVAVSVRPSKTDIVNRSMGRYFLVLDRNSRGKKQIPMRLRVKAAAP